MAKAARRGAAAEGMQSAAANVQAEEGYGTDALNPLIHQRTRLAIVSALAANQSLSFNELKRLTRATDGNLSVHARKLEEAGFVECRKSFHNRTPRTDYSLSASGRQALQRYVAHMEALIDATRRSV